MGPQQVGLAALTALCAPFLMLGMAKLLHRWLRYSLTKLRPHLHPQEAAEMDHELREIGRKLDP